jgi:hypothetical protein
MAKVKVIRRGQLTREERERGFDVRAANAPLPTYDALRDGNLRQYFESKTVQKFLQGSGWIDKEGRIIDLDKFRCVGYCLYLLCVSSSLKWPTGLGAVRKRRGIQSVLRASSGT